MNSPIRMSISPEPRSAFAVMRCDNSVIPHTPTALTKLPPKTLAAIVVVPVHSKEHRTVLFQQTMPSWNRQLIVNANLGIPSFSSPVVLSARNLWRLRSSATEVFDRAVVVDGAKRLEAAFAFSSIDEIPVTVLYGLEPESELMLHRQLHSESGLQQSITMRERVGTATPRLTITGDWVDATVVSDPFVVPTTLGYSPAILIRRNGLSHSEHILIGAKSLAVPLESIRSRNGTLNGIRISLRKQGPGRSAPYNIHVKNGANSGG